MIFKAISLISSWDTVDQDCKKSHSCCRKAWYFSYSKKQFLLLADKVSQRDEAGGFSLVSWKANWYDICTTTIPKDLLRIYLFTLVIITIIIAMTY